MESITDFLDPKSLSNIEGDDLNIDKALDNKSDLENDSDTVTVNVTNNVDNKESKPKVNDVVLPGKKEVDSETDTETETSSESSEEIKDTENSNADTSSDDSSQEEASVEQEVEKEVDTEESSTDDTSTADAENESVENEDVIDAEKDSTESDVADTIENPVDQETTNSAVDHGESDLDVDTQQPAPLLKLISEYDFYNTKIYETPNGARVVYVNKPSKLCYCKFSYKVGSFYEDDSNRGISHLIEHLMFNGCPGMSSLEFNEKLDKLGMSVNAYTDRMETAYHFSGLKSNFIVAFDLYMKLLNSFTPIQEVLDKERGVVINEIGVRNDDNWAVLMDTVYAQAYRQHPITHPVIGYEDVIRNISIDQVNDWYNTNYNACNLTVYLVGDFPEEDLVYVAGKVQQVKDGDKNADPVITDAMAEPFYKNVLTYKDGAVQTLIKSALMFNNEALNLYEIMVLSEILGGTMSSYLWKAFREDRSIAYQVSSYVSNIDPKHLFINLYAGLNDSSDAELAKSLFKDAFAYAKAISEEEFTKGQNILLSSLLKTEETEDGILDIVTESIYYGLNPDDYILTLNNMTYDSYQSFVSAIDPENMITGILYPTTN